MKLKTKVSREQQKLVDEAWLGVYIDEANISSILHVPEEFADNPQLWYTYIMSRPDYLFFICHHILNFTPHPFQLAILQEMWNRKFPMFIGSRGLGKSSLISVYCFLRMMLMPGRKIIVAGAAFRQSKLIFEYMMNMWNNAPILRDMYRGHENGPKQAVDECKFVLGRSTLKAIPIGDGSKIRGLRANDLLVDEFSSVNREIFETVLAGFGAVSSEPLKNVQEIASQKMAARLGLEFEVESEAEKTVKSNQLVISGTASYDFEHFAEYWKRWREIITSRGDLSKLARYNIDAQDFDWRDYSIIRIPYELIPEGFMDAPTVARAKATSHISTYMKEYGAVFAKDSLGFFKRSLLEACTVKETIDYTQMPEDLTVFSAYTQGDPTKKYVIGIDPASDVDNFSIVILELNKLHRKIVYCWTTNKKDHMERIKHNLTQENNYYAFCARKIRNLMKRFNIEAIAIDSQGGGKHIVDSLNDKERMESDESFLWPIIEEDKEKPTDAFAGRHIVHLINFANAEWTADANHGMKKDFEDKALIFPFFDSVVLASIQTQTAEGEKIYDTLEDCYFELQELKDELSIITHTKTPNNNRDRWDTPETKLPNGKKGRMRKDRYSALLMANSVGRTMEIRDFERRVQYQPIGGFATGLILPEDCKGNPLQQKPDWFNDDYYNYL